MEKPLQVWFGEIYGDFPNRSMARVSDDAARQKQQLVGEYIRVMMGFSSFKFIFF